MKLMKVMMNNGVFFCDTYALIEIIKGSKDYEIYTDSLLITSDLNLMELFYFLLRTYGKSKALEYFTEWEDIAVPIPKYVILKAMELKLIYKKEKLSYVDCMGYTYAQDNNILFLTGDAKFENKSGVEYIK